jgi:mono/diheme cytochrome c family protein
MTARKLALLAAAALVLAAAGYAGVVLRRGFSARDEPSRLEEALARAARTLATPAGARDLHNPQPHTPENLRDGLVHFADHCAVCHANNGSGDTLFGGNMYPRPPDLRRRTQQLSDGEIYFIIQNGVRLTGMPAFGESRRTDDAGTWNLVHFIRHLPRLTPEEEREMERHNPISRAELERQMEAERFLAGEEEAPQPQHRH